MNANVYEITQRARPQNSTSGGGGDMTDKLEKRVERLETDVSKIKEDLAVIKSNYSTKEDIQSIRTEVQAVKSELHKEILSQTRWIAGTIITVAALCMTAAKLLF